METATSKVQFGNDKELWQSFKAGNRHAFESLYNKYFKLLGSYGCRLSNDKDLVEDAIQDVFIELWRRKEYLSDCENVKFYLFRALRNQFSRNIKKDIFEGSENINHFLDFLGNLSSENEIIEAENLKIHNSRIEKALSNLTNRQSEAIHLRFYQGLNLDDIANIMQVQKQVVKNLLSKSYLILKVSLRNISTFLLFLPDFF